MFGVDRAMKQKDTTALQCPGEHFQSQNDESETLSPPRVPNLTAENVSEQMYSEEVPRTRKLSRKRTMDVNDIALTIF